MHCSVSIGAEIPYLFGDESVDPRYMETEVEGDVDCEDAIGLDPLLGELGHQHVLEYR